MLNGSDSTQKNKKKFKAKTIMKDFSLCATDQTKSATNSGKTGKNNELK